jgi:hypothetical protein
MELQKIGVKVFATAPNEIPLTDFIDIFHSWIQASDGVYHDVADYSHMQAGPGIVLVANHANVSIDEVDHRRGLLYSQKAHLDGSNQEKIRTVFRAAFDNCRRLEQEPLLRGKLKFLTNDLVFFVNDRFLAPNTEDTLTKLKPELETALGGLFGERNFALERNLNARQRFSVAVRTSESSIRTS